MESFLFHTSLDFPQQSPFLHQSDIYLEDYETLLASEEKKFFDQSESDMDDDRLQNETEERPKITSPIRKTRFQKRPRKTRGKKGHNSTKWTDDDHQKYLDFYEENQDKYSFEKKANRKKREHIFIEMSLYIGTKTPNQCKTHDQKYRQKLFKQNNPQTPVALSPESASIQLQNVSQMKNDSDSIDDCFEASYKIDESTVSTTFTDQSPSKSFYDVDRYFSLSSPSSQEINTISNFEPQEIQQKTWNTLIQGDSSNHALHIEIWSKMLDLAQSISIN